MDLDKFVNIPRNEDGLIVGNLPDGFKGYLPLKAFLKGYKRLPTLRMAATGQYDDITVVNNQSDIYVSMFLSKLGIDSLQKYKSNPNKTVLKLRATNSRFEHTDVKVLVRASSLKSVKPAKTVRDSSRVFDLVIDTRTAVPKAPINKSFWVMFVMLLAMAGYHFNPYVLELLKAL